jgi:hypothetical protein
LITRYKNSTKVLKILDIKNLITIDKGDVLLLLGWVVKFAINKKTATLNICADKFLINKFKKIYIL